MSEPLARASLETIDTDSPASAARIVVPSAEPDRLLPESGLDTHDLAAPELYLNRELTWLSFNRRVLHEAADPRTPLLERVKFLAIVSGNLDEFFMKRVGGLKNLVLEGREEPSVDGRTPQQQIAACRLVVQDIQREREAVVREVLAALRAHGIGIVSWSDLDAEQRSQLREHFVRNIFPLVTPLAMDPGHPFPFISNLALNLLVTMRFPGDRDTRMARVKVPASKDIAPRLQRVGSSNVFVLLEDIIANNLDLLFPGMKIESCSLFRITRNARLALEQGSVDDLLELIKSELEERPFQPIVRLQVAAGIDPVQIGMLTAELGLEPEDVFEVRGMMAMEHLWQIATLKLPELRDPPYHPVDHWRLVKDPRRIFHIVRDGGPLLLQHPYESFATSVERFLSTAALDPKVLAIKMTLYRTSAEGNIVQHLIDAARNGKQVAVLVELQARFDEAANIRWARRLEEVGIHVTYGVVGLKTHTKMTLIVRRDYDGLRRYVHVGTGNYHPGTARLYSDLGLISCDDALGADLTELFNFLTGYSSPQSYRKILVAPYNLKRALLEKIEREIEHARAGAPASIQLKTNALEDGDITRALYRASQAGVLVDLIVRDTCRLRPGIAGLSENVRVLSIVGRFLEHSRIYYFRNAGQEEYYIGSPDLMGRNLEGRVEVLVPVETPELRDDLRRILNVQLQDRRRAWEMQPDGSYVLRQPRSEAEQNDTHGSLIALAAQRTATAKAPEPKGHDRRLPRQRKRIQRS
jgi:polyphosphate kinase